MFLNQKPKYGYGSTKRNNLLFLFGLLNLIYWIELQLFTPPHNIYTTLPARPKWINNPSPVAALHSCCDEGLFCKQYVYCCTTKYIFRLGKNKFD
jgi:hypothetical protein